MNLWKQLKRATFTTHCLGRRAVHSEENHRSWGQPIGFIASLLSAHCKHVGWTPLLPSALQEEISSMMLGETLKLPLPTRTEVGSHLPGKMHNSMRVCRLVLGFNHQTSKEVTVAFDTRLASSAWVVPHQLLGFPIRIHQNDHLGMVGSTTSFGEPHMDLFQQWQTRFDLPFPSYWVQAVCFNPHACILLMYHVTYPHACICVCACAIFYTYIYII